MAAKCSLILIVVFLLLLCLSCSRYEPEYDELTESSEPNESDESDVSGEGEETSQPFHKDTFNEEKLLGALREAGLDNWSTDYRWDSMRAQRDDPLDQTLSSFVVLNDDSTVISSFNFGSSQGESCDISFGYYEQTPEDYNRFQREQWPLFWSFAGILLESQETVAQLRDQCTDYFDGCEVEGQEGAKLKWCGKLDDIYCETVFVWHKLLGMYVAEDIILKNSVFAESDMFSEAQYKLKGYEISKVAEIDVDGIANAGEDIFHYCVVKGNLKNLQPNDDALDLSNFLNSLPANVDNYRKADLVDDTGKMTVYIVPTALTNEELSEERIHLMTIVKAPKPYCIITMSTSKLFLLK